MSPRSAMRSFWGPDGTGVVSFAPTPTAPSISELVARMLAEGEPSLSIRANATREGTVIANYRLRMPLALTFESIVELVERQKAKDQVHPFLFKEMVRVSALGDARRCRDAHGAHGHQCTHTLDWVAQRSASKPDPQLKWVELRGNGVSAARLAPNRDTPGASLAHRQHQLSS